MAVPLTVHVRRVPRWLAGVVLGAATTVLALVGIAGGRQVLEPSPPHSAAELSARIGAAGFPCGGATTDGADASTFVCGEDPDAVFVIYHRLPTVGPSGSYVPLTSLGAEPGELSGDRFTVLGPYETLVRVQEEVGGSLQRMSR